MSMLSGPVIKSGLSAGGVLVTDKYYGADIMSSMGLKRGAIQFFSSLWRSTLESWLRMVLPSSLQLSTMVVGPLGVGLTFALTEKFVDGNVFGFQFNFLESALSEVAASLMTGMGSAFGSGSGGGMGMVTSPSVSSAYT